jgi:uncharacterized small protein (DUF1192 family)
MTPPLRDAAAPVGGDRGEADAGHRAGAFHGHDTMTFASTSSPPEPPAPLADVVARLPGLKAHPRLTGWLAGCPLCRIDFVISVSWRGGGWAFEAACGHRLHELAAAVADRPAQVLPPPTAPQPQPAPAPRPMSAPVSRRDGHRPVPGRDRTGPAGDAAASASRVAELEARIARLEAENARLRQRARRCALRAWRERQRVREVERRLEHLEALHGRAMAVLRNPGLNPSERLVAVATALEVAHQAARDERPDDAPTRVSVQLIAEQAGVSRDTAGAALKRLAAVGLLERTEERSRTPSGEARTEIHVRLPGGPLATLWRAACFKPRTAAEARRHGGRRERRLRVEPCPEHPTAPITAACAVCGRALQAIEAPRPPEPPGPDGGGGGGPVRHLAAHKGEIPSAEVFASEAAGRCGRCGRPATLLFLGVDGARCADCQRLRADSNCPCGKMPHQAGPQQPPFDDDLPFEPPGAGDDGGDGDAEAALQVETQQTQPIGSCPRCGGALARAPGFLNWAQCISCRYAVWIGPAS